MRLPVLTFQEACELVWKLVDTEGDAALILPPDEMLPALTSVAILLYGKLEETKAVIENLQASNAEMAAANTELGIHLRAYAEDVLRRGLESDEEPPEVVGWMAEYSVAPEVLEVRWEGTSEAYFEHFEAINREMAGPISDMMRAQLQAGVDRLQHPDAIDVDARESSTETPPGIADGDTETPEKG